MITSPQKNLQYTPLFFKFKTFNLHQLRNKFLQLILISLNSASWELHQYWHWMCGPMKNPVVETGSWTRDIMIAKLTLNLTNPLPDDKILDWSKLKQIADNFLKCIWNEK